MDYGLRFVMDKEKKEVKHAGVLVDGFRVLERGRGEIILSKYVFSI